MKGECSMKTLQQKEFEYSDILLYKIVESNNKKLIIVIINDINNSIYSCF